MKETNQGFAACLFHPNLGNEVIHGRIHLDLSALHFQSGTLHETIPVENLEIEADPKGGRVDLTDSERPDLVIYTLDRSILKAWRNAPANAVRYQIRAIAGRRRFSRALAVSLWLIVAGVVLTWLGSWAISAMVRTIVARLPPQWEADFGEEQMKRLRERDVLLEDTNRINQLAALARPLTKVVSDNGTEFKFHIMEMADPNAFALPGGHVVVTTGMLEMVDRPEELLGVLAHEFAHVTRKHHARKMIASAGPMIVFGVFLRGGGGGSLLAGGSALMVVQGFSQEYETEADDVGWQYLVKADIDPRGMTSLFRKLKAYDVMEKMGMGLPQAFSSHPALDKRIARLDAKWRRLSPVPTFLQLTNPIPRIETVPKSSRQPRLLR